MKIQLSERMSCATIICTTSHILLKITFMIKRYLYIYEFISLKKIWKNWSMGLKWGPSVRRSHVCNVINIILLARNRFWPSVIVVVCFFLCVFVAVCQCVCVCTSLSCPCHRSSPIQAGTIKLRQKMQNTLVKIPMVLGLMDLDIQG